MSTSYVGEIRMFAGNFAPAGWMFCAGQLLPISQYSTLFQLIGTTYGGDGTTTFALPDLRGRIPVHAGPGPSGTNYTLGQMAGTETVTLTPSQMPSHTHAAVAQSGAGTQVGPANAVWSDTSLPQYSQNNANSTMDARIVGATGGSQPHTNMMPYLAVSFIIFIDLTGIYPSP